MVLQEPTAIRPLFKAAFWLSLVMLLLIPVQIVVFVASPPPQTVQGFFELFHAHPFLGLLSLDFLYLFNNAILMVVYVAVFFLLTPHRPVTSLLALIVGLVGIACYYPSNPAFEMMTLSKQFLAATPTHAPIYIGAGEAVMAGYTGTSFNSYYVLNSICLILYAHGFLTTSRFRKSIGIWGLASGLLMAIPSSAGMIGMVFSLLSLVPWMVFVALLLRVFVQEGDIRPPKAGDSGVFRRRHPSQADALPPPTA